MVTAIAPDRSTPSDVYTSRRTSGSSSGDRQISNGLDAERIRSRSPSGSQTALVCTPPMSQPTISGMYRPILVKGDAPFEIWFRGQVPVADSHTGRG